MGKVYIKGFKMPEHGCIDCPFAEWEYCWVKCVINGREREDKGEDKRPRGCPLHEEKEKKEWRKYG